MARQASKAGMREFENDFSEFARRHSHFHAVGPLPMVWPDEAFLDHVHMETSYANRFSERVKACRDAALIGRDLPLQSGPRETLAIARPLPYHRRRTGGRVVEGTALEIQTSMCCPLQSDGIRRAISGV